MTLIDADITGSNELGYSGSYEVWEYNTTGLIYLGFQTAHGVCQKAEVRQAIAKAIDRSYVTDNVYARHATAATLPVHPDSALYDTELAQELEYDLSALKELGLEGKSLTLLVNIEDMAKSAAAQPHRGGPGIGRPAGDGGAPGLGGLCESAGAGTV